MLSGRVVRPYLGVRMVTVDRCEVDLEYALQQVSWGLFVTVSFVSVTNQLCYVASVHVSSCSSNPRALLTLLATHSILIV
jgi:hypothetical protein